MKIGKYLFVKSVIILKICVDMFDRHFSSFFSMSDSASQALPHAQPHRPISAMLPVPLFCIAGFHLRKGSGKIEALAGTSLALLPQMTVFMLMTIPVPLYHLPLPSSRM